MLTWDDVGARIYETGLDRGVLYHQDGTATAWNGLVSVEEAANKSRSEIYFDGQKVNDLVYPGGFSATLKAITYPDEFLQYEGFDELGSGVYAGDQKPKQFHLSYRTKFGDDALGDSLGYKITVIYNITAIPSDKEHATQGSDVSLTEFQWSLTAIPEEYVGIRPTARIVFDSRKMDPEVLAEVETLLYGDELTDATLPSFAYLMDYASVLIRITDNGDGTWTAYTRRPGLINVDAFGEFEIVNANETIIDANTYDISNTPF